MSRHLVFILANEEILETQDLPIVGVQVEPNVLILLELEDLLFHREGALFGL